MAYICLDMKNPSVFHLVALASPYSVIHYSLYCSNLSSELNGIKSIIPSFGILSFNYIELL